MSLFVVFATLTMNHCHFFRILLPNIGKCAVPLQHWPAPHYERVLLKLDWYPDAASLCMFHSYSIVINCQLVAGFFLFAPCKYHRFWGRSQSINPASHANQWCRCSVAGVTCIIGTTVMSTSLGGIVICSEDAKKDLVASWSGCPRNLEEDQKRIADLDKLHLLFAIAFCLRCGGVPGSVAATITFGCVGELGSGEGEWFHCFHG